MAGQIRNDGPGNKDSAAVSAQPTLQLEWHFLQCFGQPNAAEAAPNADLLSALKFNHTGEFLATGDRGGRIVLLQQTERTSPNQQQRSDAPEDGRWMLPMEFHYLSEFQAHQPDFDYLKSIEIPEKINSISWLQGCGSTHMLLSANDKQVKLWKIYDRTAHTIANYNHGPSNGSGLLPPNGATLGHIADGHALRVPSITGSTKTLEAKCKLSYDANAHLYFINSVSMCPDQATFISADDLTVHLWNLDRMDGHQTILDMRPTDANYSESVHVVTSASFHPQNSDLLGYSTTKTLLSIVDLRQKDLRGEGALAFANSPNMNTSTMHFHELVTAASKFEFSQDGIHAVTRDYMHTTLWDIRKASQPIKTFQIHPHLWDRLGDMYDNECIFDRLGCAVSPSGRHVAAGAYGELAVFDAANDNFSLLKTCVQPFTQNGVQERSEPFPVSHKWKVENVTWHPSRHLIVATSLNSLFTFCARPSPGL